MSDIDIDDVRKLDGRQLLVFRELMRRHSVTAAAAELHLSQSAVSHTLARLRAIHGDALFTRRPHGLEPTRRAQELAPLVERIIELSVELHGGEVQWMPGTSTRRFDVAAPEFVVAVLGPQLLTRWERSAPGVGLATRQLAHGEVARRLERGDLDLAIGRFGRRQPAAVAREVLYRDEYCVVASRVHPQVSGGIDMERYRTLGHVVAGATSEGDEDETIPAGLRIRTVVPGWTTALSIVSVTDAIATCPRRLAEHHSETFGLQILDLPGEPIGIEVSILRRDGDPSAARGWLIDEIRRAAER